MLLSGFEVNRPCLHLFMWTLNKMQTLTGGHEPASPTGRPCAMQLDTDSDVPRETHTYQTHLLFKTYRLDLKDAQTYLDNYIL